MSTSAVMPPPDTGDQGVPWHYGHPHQEQKLLQEGRAAVDMSHLAVLTITGKDRLTWLQSLSTADLSNIPPRGSALTLILDAHGHVEFELHVINEPDTTWIIVEPDRVADLEAYLQSMVFMLDVSIARPADVAVAWLPGLDIHPDYPTWIVPAEFAGTGETPTGVSDAPQYVPSRPETLIGRQVIVARDELSAVLAEYQLAGTWAWNAVRVAAGVPRQGWDTDEKTLPHEVGWIGPGVHLNKGCYRGQETVARIVNVGAPPRRLTLIHLADNNDLPAHGDPIVLDGKVVGWVGTTARHYESGPIALGMVKKSVPLSADVNIDGQPGRLEPIVVITPRPRPDHRGTLPPNLQQGRKGLL